MDTTSLRIAINTQDALTAKKNLDSLGSSIGKVDKAVGSLTASLTSMPSILTGVVASLGIKELTKYADTFTTIESKLKLVTTSTKEFTRAQNELFKISQNTRTSLETSVDLYQKLYTSTETLNISQTRLLNITETINKASKISGGSNEALNASLIQLGQGLASGTLRGEELNSVLEQNPRLAKLIADGIGVQVGALKSLAEQGKITAKEVIKAVESQAKAIDTEYKKVQTTVAQSFTVAENSVIDFVGRLDNATGATKGISDAIIGLSSTLSENKDDFVAYGRFIYATIDRTIDIFNLLYEVVENGAQNTINGLQLMSNSAMDTILAPLLTYTEALGQIGVIDTKDIQAVQDLKNSYALKYNETLKDIKENETEVLDAYDKITLSVEDRVAAMKREEDAQKSVDEVRQKSTNKSKEDIEKQEKADKQAKKAKEDALKLEKNYYDTIKSLQQENQENLLDGISKEALQTFNHYEDLKNQYASVKGAREALDVEYNNALNIILNKNVEDTKKSDKELIEWKIKIYETQKELNDELYEQYSKMYGINGVADVERWYQAQIEQIDKLAQEGKTSTEEIDNLYETLAKIKDLKLKDTELSFKINKSFFDSFENGLASSMQDALKGNFDFSKFTAGITDSVLGTITQDLSKQLTSSLSSLLGGGMMGGMMGGIAVAGVIAGVSLLGAELSKYTETWDAHSKQVANTGTGSVLGDSSKQSESIAKSLSLLEDLAKPEFRLFSEMNKSLLSIEKALAGTSRNISQTGGFAMGAGFTPSSSTSGGLGSTIGTIGTAILGGGVGLAIDKFLLGGAISSFIGGIGGSNTTRHITDAGITFGNQLVESAIKGIEGASYQTILTSTRTSGFFSSSTKNSYSTRYGGMASDTAREFTLILDNIYDTVIMAGKGLDVATGSVEKSLSDFYVNLGKISLMGKSQEQIQKDLTAIFGKVGDEMATDAFPLIKAFQQIGEGMFESLVRVSAGMQEAEYYIDRLGKGFKEISYTDISDKQGNVGFEALAQSIIKFDEAVFGANNGVVQMIESMNTEAEELYDTYRLFEDLRVQIGLTGQDAKYLTSEMLLGAGGVAELSDAMSSYFDNFLSESERIATTTEQLAKEFNKLDVAMPTSVQGFKDLVGSIDISTASGQELYGRVLLLADGFSELQKSLENFNFFDDEIKNALELSQLKRSLADQEAEQMKRIASSLSSAFADIRNTITSIISSLRDDTIDGAGSLTRFNLVMKDAGEQLKKGDYDKFNETIKEVSKYSVALNNADLFETANEQTYAKLVAANNLEYMNGYINEEIDYLKNIDENTDNTNASLNVLSSAIERYNNIITQSLNTAGGLDFTDFKAGGLLQTGDEIEFRQSFKAESASSFKKELEELRNNLAYLSLSTVDTSKFLDGLSKADSTAFNNIVEFANSTKSMGAIQDLDFFRKLSSGDFSSMLNDITMMSKVMATSYADTARNQFMNSEGFRKEYASFSEVVKLLNNSELLAKGGYESGGKNLERLNAYDLYKDNEAIRAVISDGIDFVEKYRLLMDSITWKNALTTSRTNGSSAEQQSNIEKQAKAYQAITDVIKGGGYFSDTTYNAILNSVKNVLSWEGYKLPSFAVGTPSVPYDMMANIHKGEMIVPQSFNSAIQSGNITLGNNDALVSELRTQNAKLNDIIAVLKETKDISNGSLAELQSLAEAV